MGVGVVDKYLGYEQIRVSGEEGSKITVDSESLQELTSAMSALTTKSA